MKNKKPNGNEKIIVTSIVILIAILIIYTIHLNKVIERDNQFKESLREYQTIILEENQELKHDNELLLTGYATSCDNIQEIEELRIISDDGLYYDYELKPRKTIIR